MQINEPYEAWLWRPVRMRAVLVSEPQSYLKPRPLSPASKARLKQIVKKSPQTMVKVTGRKYGAQHLKSHLDYISRNGKVEVKLNGEKVLEKDDINDLVELWALNSENLSKTRPIASCISMVFSMPEGTDREKFRNAVLDFAEDKVFPKLDAVIAFHDDTGCPHAHISIAGIDKFGKTFNPRKAMLVEWRQVFAEKLRHRGVEADSTPRYTRAVGMKSDNSTVKQIHAKKKSSTIVRTRIEEVYEEKKQNKKIDEPWKASILSRRKLIFSTLMEAAASLAHERDETGYNTKENTKLSRDILDYARSLGQPITRMDSYRAMVDKALKNKGIDLPKPPEAPEPPRTSPMRR